MSAFWSLEPEVAGELGDGSIVDTGVHPPIVSKLQYVFTGWLGDELLESFPCFIVTVGLAEAIASMSGFSLDFAEVLASSTFRELYPGRGLPEFRWLRVTGRAGVDDFGLDSESRLVVSDAALEILRRFPLEHCDVEKYERGR